jgi:nucleoid-associated protein YgaU
MKQNERLLVYAVTGFLAVILVIAVLFGPSGREVVGAVKPGATPAARGLGDLLGQKSEPANVPAADPAAPKAGDTASGAGLLPAPGEVTRQQPLVAVDPATVAADLLAQQLGQSHRDRTVRLVRARAGDSLEMLVRRWCGARDPFLDEAKALNEELTVLRVGQEVCVPWVDDTLVLAALEANQPRTLMTNPATPVSSPAGSGMPGVGSLQSVLGGRPVNGAATVDAGDAKPTFAEPGRALADAGANADAAARPRGATDYTVKSGDALWKIADRTYGREHAARMVREILAANPGLTAERLKVGQKIVLPAAN